MNSICALNEYCQKNGLNFNFERETFSDLQKFTVHLNIFFENFKNCVLKFSSTNTLLKQAKLEAIEQASKVQIIDELKKKIKEHKSISNSLNAFTDLTNRTQNMAIISKSDKEFYNVWNFAKLNGLAISLEHSAARRDSSTEIILKLANESIKGIGSNDTESINDCVRNLDLENLYKKKLSDHNERNNMQDETFNCVGILHEMDQKSKINVKFDFILSSGPDQDPVFIYKCLAKGQVTYGIGKNKKEAKNQSAYEMVKKLKLNINTKPVATKQSSRCTLQQILKSTENAIGLLEMIDNLKNKSLNYEEESYGPDDKPYFVVKCTILFTDEMNIKADDLNRNSVKRDNLVFLKTSCRSAKKKVAKLESAEKMINLIKGFGAKTNEELLTNDSNDFQSEMAKIETYTIDLKTMTKIFDAASNFLKDKTEYDPVYDFFAMIERLEKDNKRSVSIKTRVLEDVSAFQDTNISPRVSYLIHFKCGIVITGFHESSDAKDSKNRSAFMILKKLSKRPRDF